LIKALQHNKKGHFCQLLKAICDDEEGWLDHWFEAVSCHVNVYFRHLLNSLRDLQAVWASKNGRGSSLLSTQLHLTLLTLQDMWRIPFLEPWVTPLGNFQRVCDQDQHWMGCFQDDCQVHLGAKLSVGIFPRWYFDYESREAFLNFFWTSGHKCSYLDIAFGQHRSWRVYQDETIKNGKPYMVDLEATFKCRQSDWSVVEIRQTSSFNGNTVIIRACRTSLRPALPSETAIIVVHGVGWCPMYSPDSDELGKDQFVQVKSGERTSGYELRGACPSKPIQKFTNRNQAQALKREGNSFYKNGRLDRALMAYETALAVIESCPRSNPVITLKVQILSNLTQVVLQVGSREYSFHNNLFEEISKESTDAAIASQLLVKSLYRCARAFTLLNNNSEQALTCLQRCESYNRNNVDVQRLRNELENERRVIAYICVLWLLFLTHRGSLESTA
jgi:tetratricopeptide (TPR) repeat protein